MIVKNEENILGRCLESVKDIVDEIIIVDTGSDDKTKEIAFKYTDKVYDFIWEDNFSAARNFSFSKATKDYQMWLDADDILLEEDAKKLAALKQNLDRNVDIVTFKYNTHFDKNNKPILTLTRERLFKREKSYRWNDPVHEYILMMGKVFDSDIYVTHKKISLYTDRNLKIYEKLIDDNKELSPRSIFYFASELKDNMHYDRAALYFERFLNEGKGWVEDNISASFKLNSCYKMINYHSRRMPVLLKSFEIASPRAEICCSIGELFIEKNMYQSAEAWYMFAVNLTKPITQGFILNDYWDYIPNIQLCICNYRLGNIEKAIYYNEQAAKYKPDCNAVLYNKTFFEKV